jgi:hypothetical protein
MENTRDRGSGQLYEDDNWSKEESEKLILLYLEDYYQTLDEEFLKEALQIAKDEGIDIQKILRKVKSKLS